MGNLEKRGCGVIFVRGTPCLVARENQQKRKCIFCGGPQQKTPMLSEGSAWETNLVETRDSLQQAQRALTQIWIPFDTHPDKGENTQKKQNRLTNPRKNHKKTRLTNQPPRPSGREAFRQASLRNLNHPELSGLWFASYPLTS